MKPLLIAGPTASGKSAYALREAAKGGVVINADASQVYDGWRVLTARPSEEEEAAAPHMLYGHVDPGRRYSVGSWLRDVRVALDECEQMGLRAIIIGGTGLYFKALTEGLAEIPTTDEEVRRIVGERLRREGLFFLANELKRLDPETAAIVDLNNPMRVLRALEVLEATGKGLAAWREETPPPLVAEADKVLVTMERDALYERCDRRFELMLEQGA
ncbi:MAG: tRNA (adenosine(37)-N6)-dimethylallyltransferase MiaA, partial [Pseudomonadota bacterium]